MAQVRNAAYKGGRLVNPSQDASKYVCIDEVIPLPIVAVTASKDSCNLVTLWEPKFTATPFINSSTLMQAFMANYKQYRCRSVEVILESTKCGLEHERVETAIYWIPNHYEFDNDTDTVPQTWNMVLEKDRVSRVTRSGGRNGIRLHYIPQMVYQEDVDEDEDPPAPDTVFQVRGDFKCGWLPTDQPYRTLDFRGPALIFRRPYTNLEEAPLVVQYCVNVRCVFEFRNAKADV